MSDPIRAAREAAAKALMRSSLARIFDDPDEFRDAVEEDSLHPNNMADASAAIAAFLRTPGLSAALHDLMQRPENVGRPWAEVLAEAVEGHAESDQEQPR